MSEGKYDAVKAKFAEGSWIVGTGEHRGCSQTFDYHTDNPQPFSYLDAKNPDDFRLATDVEIQAARKLIEDIEGNN